MTQQRPLTRDELDDLVAAGDFRDIGQWNVSQIVSMDRLFEEYYTFDEDLSGWDMTNVQTTNFMFAGAITFRGRGLDRWRLPNLQDAGWMFADALAFDADVSTWDMGACTSAEAMFFRAVSFTGRGLERWNTARVVTCKSMFDGAAAMNGSLAGWNLNACGDTTEMFSGAAAFEGRGLDTWTMTGTTRCYAKKMFAGATRFDADLGTWFPEPRLTNAEGMFSGATAFRGRGVDRWDMTLCQRINDMFTNVPAYENAWTAQWVLWSIDLRRDRRLVTYHQVAPEPLETVACPLDAPTTMEDMTSGFGDEVNVDAYLAESPEHLVFYWQGRWYTAPPRPVLLRLLQTDKSKTMYPCTVTDGTLRAVVRDRPYVLLRFLTGLLGGLARLGQVKTLLQTPAVRMVHVGRVLERVAGLASWDVMDNEEDSRRSGQHCQEGSAADVHVLSAIAHAPRDRGRDREEEEGGEARERGRPRLAEGGGRRRRTAGRRGRTRRPRKHSRRGARRRRGRG